jgi:radical SAM protein with 4Fe4S-binding SPASM domain
MDLTPSGNVVTCDVLGEAVANIFEDGVVGAWKKLMSSGIMRSLNKPPPECMRCPVANVCRGGCYARAKLLRGRYNAKDPLCPLNF